MLLRNGRTLEPPASISSVDRLSPTVSSTGRTILSSMASKSGIAVIFGPLSSSVPLLSSGGASIKKWSIFGAGAGISGYPISSVLGSVISPAKADVAAVSGLHRNTASSTVPERPGKFLGVVLRSEEHTSELQSRLDLV